MCAIDITTALGRLLTNADLRAAFSRDPAGVLDTMALSPDHRRVLLSLDISELQAQAETLLNKRLREVGALLPVTFAAIGGGVRGHFETYAGSNWPASHTRHVDDAIGFGKYLLVRGIEGASRIELNRLRFQRLGRWCRVHLVTRHLVAGRRRSVMQVLLYLPDRTRHEWLVYLAI